MTTPIKLRCLLDGGRYYEGPRWHAGRLWFVDCMARTLLSLSLSGECTQHAKLDGHMPCGAATSYEELRQRKSSSRIDVTAVEVAGAGYP